jgi:hypothetical protein
MFDPPDEIIELSHGYDIAIWNGYSVRIRHKGHSIAQPIEPCRSRVECLVWARKVFQEKGADYAALSTLMYSLSNIHPL